MPNYNPGGTEKSSSTLKEEQRKTSFDHATGGRFPGDFEVQSIFLTSPSFKDPEKIVDLSSAWTEINLFEDIYSPAVSGDVTLVQSGGFVEGIPIIGEETLEIHMSVAGAETPPMPYPGDHSTDESVTKSVNPLIKGKYRIYKNDPPQPLAKVDGVFSYKFYFVSEEMITNMKIKVQKAYPTTMSFGAAYPQMSSPSSSDEITIDQITRSLFYDCFIGAKKPADQNSTSKNFLVEPTTGTVSYVIPNWTPFQALNFLAGRAVSVNSRSPGSNFVFYETLRGYRFVSIETLQAGGFRGYKLEGDLNEVSFSHYKRYPSEGDAKSASPKASFIPVYERQYNQPEIKHTIVYSTSTQNIRGQAELDRRFIVYNHRLVKSPDSIQNLGVGMYANRMITHDLVKMKVEEWDYHYTEPKDEISLDGISSTETNKDKKAADENVLYDTAVTPLAYRAETYKLSSEENDYTGRAEAYTMLVSSNKDHSQDFKNGIVKNSYIDKDGRLKTGIEMDSKTVYGGKASRNPAIFEKHIEDWMRQKVSQRQQVDNIKLAFSAPGDSAREVGDVIWFNFLSNRPTPTDDGHKYLNGRYLITGLRHQIKSNLEYTIHVEAMKDSYKHNISEGFALNDPVLQNPDGTVTGSSAIGRGGKIKMIDGRIVGGL